jgi:fermentation-respiration switch protein FrsA (DUF1100 family)
MRSYKKYIKKISLRIFAFYCVILILTYIFQRNLIYFPFGKILITPQEFEEINLKTKDNEEIYAWFKPAQENQNTILYFHGNAGNLSGRTNRFEKFALNYGVMAISYRGYAKSKGNPTEEGLYFDAESALDFLRSKKINTENIILYGESLGTAMVIKLASQHEFKAMILEAPFTSIASIAKETYWFLPVDIILKDRFDSIKIAKKIKSPTLIFHAINDKIVPFKEGENLYNSLETKKKIIPLIGNFHIGISPEFAIDQLNTFLKN